MLVVVAVFGLARADDKALQPYAGQIVISPDPVPASTEQLAAFLKANATKDGHYELIKGPPWDVNLVGVLSKAGTGPVTLVIADASDPKLAPLLSTELTAKQRLVIAHIAATIAAGFAANKTYVVTLVRGKTVLAKAELTLRS
jgi:hypothetical protein